MCKLVCLPVIKAQGYSRGRGAHKQSLRTPCPPVHPRQLLLRCSRSPFQTRLYRLLPCNRTFYIPVVVYMVTPAHPCARDIPYILYIKKGLLLKGGLILKTLAAYSSFIERLSTFASTIDGPTPLTPASSSTDLKGPCSSR